MSSLPPLSVGALQLHSLPHWSISGWKFSRGGRYIPRINALGLSRHSLSAIRPIKCSFEISAYSQGISTN